jgi:hypothetical protein
MGVCTTTFIRNYKIVSRWGVLLREPGTGDGDLWGEGQPLIFESEREALEMLDRYFTRKQAKVVRA